MKMSQNAVVALTPAQLLLAFLMKYGLACLYGYIFLHYYGGDDTWMLHKEAILQAELFRSNPSAFFSELLPSPDFDQYTGLKFLTLYFSDLEIYIQVKTLGLFSLITGGNYYLNALLFSMIMIWGQYWIYQLITEHFPGYKFLYYLLIFFFVPIVFWISGIRSDAWLFLSLALLFYSFNRWLYRGNPAFLILTLFGFVGAMVFRLPYALLAIPALLAWLLHVKAKKRLSVSIISVYGLFVLVFFGSFYFSEERALTKLIVERQQEFATLNGNTRYNIGQLDANPWSFLEATPAALINVLVRPFPGEASGALQYLSILENLLVCSMIAAALFMAFRNRRSILFKEVLVVLLVYSISTYVLIGWIVPFPGAIVRYRALPELLLLVTLIPTANLRIKKNNIR